MNSKTSGVVRVVGLILVAAFILGPTGLNAWKNGDYVIVACFFALGAMFVFILNALFSGPNTSARK